MMKENHAASWHDTILTCPFYWEWLLLTGKIMPDLESAYPKTPMSNLTDSLILYYTFRLIISSCPHLQKRGQLRICCDPWRYRPLTRLDPNMTRPQIPETRPFDLTLNTTLQTAEPKFWSYCDILKCKMVHDLLLISFGSFISWEHHIDSKFHIGRICKVTNGPLWAHRSFDSVISPWDKTLSYSCRHAISTDELVSCCESNSINNTDEIIL